MKNEECKKCGKSFIVEDKLCEIHIIIKGIQKEITLCTPCLMLSIDFMTSEKN